MLRLLLVMAAGDGAMGQEQGCGQEAEQDEQRRAGRPLDELVDPDHSGQG